VTGGLAITTFDTGEEPIRPRIGSFRRARPIAAENRRKNRNKEEQVRLTMAVVFLVIASVANAQESPLAKIGLSGIGATSCSQVISNYRKRQPEQQKAMFGVIYLSWAQGFMSGINRGNDALNKPVKNLEAWSPSVQTEHLMAYCDKNSSKLFVTSVFYLFYSLPEFSEQN
jgi:hypothetical protein